MLISDLSSPVSVTQYDACLEHIRVMYVDFC